uniref:Uncharacterized protein n=1 Tax=Vitrella brassicaformis TaxID=1169539 RepID=A0A7S1K5I7_9ALVE|mmetsp:Transcript_3697/g.8436  ORF Transcript_3697/g.8436 Transcript_3697/m.8436 type:complete len:131 (+) Transcript_3697:77-469(+)
MDVRWGVLYFCIMPLWLYVTIFTIFFSRREAHLRCLSLLAPLIVGFFMCGLYRNYRSKLRSHYDIEASDGCGDRCVVLLCWPCSAMQEYRHVFWGGQGHTSGAAQAPQVAAPVYQSGRVPQTQGTPQLFT